LPELYFLGVYTEYQIFLRGYLKYKNAWYNYLEKTCSCFGVFKREKGKNLSPPPKQTTSKLTASGVTPDYIVIISQVHCVGNGLAAKTYGRGGGTRTPSRRFWRAFHFISMCILLFFIVL